MIDYLTFMLHGCLILPSLLAYRSILKWAAVVIGLRVQDSEGSKAEMLQAAAAHLVKDRGKCWQRQNHGSGG